MTILFIFRECFIHTEELRNPDVHHEDETNQGAWSRQIAALAFVRPRRPEKQISSLCFGVKGKLFAAYKEEMIQDERKSARMQEEDERCRVRALKAVLNPLNRKSAVTTRNSVHVRLLNRCQTTRHT